MQPRALLLPAPCRALNFITAVCALLCGVAFAMAIVVRVETPSSSRDLMFHSGQAVRVFGIAIALLIMLVETEWQVFMKLVPLLDAWMARGLLQVGRLMLVLSWERCQGC
jgi:hypothetical protein